MTNQSLQIRTFCFVTMTQIVRSFNWATRKLNLFILLLIFFCRYGWLLIKEKKEVSVISNVNAAKEAGRVATRGLIPDRLLEYSNYQKFICFRVKWVKAAFCIQSLFQNIHHYYSSSYINGIINGNSEMQAVRGHGVSASPETIAHGKTRWKQK